MAVQGQPDATIEKTQGQGQDQNDDIEIVQPSFVEETPVAASTEEDGSITIEVPEDIDDPDVAEEFISKLTPEQLKDFQNNFLNKGGEKGKSAEGDPDPADAGSAPPPKEGGAGKAEDGEGAAAAASPIPAEIIEALEPEHRAYISGLEAQVKELSSGAIDYARKEVREGLEKLLADPVVANRLAVLNGNAKDEVMEGMGQFMHPQVLRQLRLDFDMDPRGSAQRLQAHVTKLIDAARASERAVFKAESDKREAEAAFDRELGKIVQADKRLESSIPMRDPKHPLATFLKWVEENKSNVNLVGLGGPETYALWLHKTGQKTGLDLAQGKKAQSETLRKINEAKRNAAQTLGRAAKPESQGGSTDKLGIDAKRFRTDDGYADMIWRQHGDNPEIRKYLMSLATE